MKLAGSSGFDNMQLGPLGNNLPEYKQKIMSDARQSYRRLSAEAQGLARLGGDKTHWRHLISSKPGHVKGMMDSVDQGCFTADMSSHLWLHDTATIDCSSSSL